MDKGNRKYKVHLALHTEFWSKFWRNYPSSKEDRILDFGCGTGLSIYTAKSLGYSIVGLDVDRVITNDDPTFSEFHSTYAVEDDIVFYSGSGVLPFEDSSFDSIICYSSLLQDNTVSPDSINLAHADMSRLENRIQELIRVSKIGASWLVAPVKDWKAVKDMFDEHNNKVRRIWIGDSSSLRLVNIGR